MVLINRRVLSSNRPSLRCAAHMYTYAHSARMHMDEPSKAWGGSAWGIWEASGGEWK